MIIYEYNLKNGVEEISKRAKNDVMPNLLSNAKRLLTLEELHCIIFFNTRSRKKFQTGGGIYMSSIGQVGKVASKGSIVDNRQLSDFHRGDKDAGGLRIAKHEYIGHKKDHTCHL